MVRVPLRLKKTLTPAPATVPAIQRLVGHDDDDERSEGGTPAVVTMPDWAPLRAPKARGLRVGFTGPLSHGLPRGSKRKGD